MISSVPLNYTNYNKYRVRFSAVNLPRRENGIPTMTKPSFRRRIVRQGKAEGEGLKTGAGSVKTHAAQ